MSYASREADIFRRGKDDKGKVLNATEREQLLKPYLPAPRANSPNLEASLKPPPTPSGHPAKQKYEPRSLPFTSLLHKRKGFSLRGFVSNLLHKIIFFLIHLVFSIYVRLRQAYHAILDRTFSILYYHHRTPELIQRDVKNLQRLPKHLSVIVDLQADGPGDRAGPEGLSRLIGDVSELAAWCSCIGIPLLSVYERTGALKTHMASLHAEVDKTLSAYFAPAYQPIIHLRAAPDNRSSNGQPNHAADAELGSDHTINGDQSNPSQKPTTLNILLLSASDGRATLVDLTKTLTEMSQRGKLSSADISPELIHAEIEESSCSEPDLLVVMAAAEGRRPGPRETRRRKRSNRRRRRSRRSSSGSGGSSSRSPGNNPGSEAEASDHEYVGGGGVCLQGYPPWQVRLTEIFYVQDNAGIGYQIFLRALHRYAKAEMRFGR